MVALWRRHGPEYQLPSRANSWGAIGGLLLFMLLLQAVTGALLLVHFVPEVDAAFASVEHIMRSVSYGWLIRLVHAHGANWMVVALFVHLFRVALTAGYKEPREVTWITGCVLFILVLGWALTGYILPWSQLSYWATTVVTASIQYVPFVGEELVAWVRGAELVGPSTFRRAFVAHVALLPAAVFVVLAVHLALVRRHDPSSPPIRRGTPTTPDRSIPFHPHFVVRYGILAVGYLMLLVAGVIFAPMFFFPAETLIPADPFDTPPNVKPEWYFLWAYQLPRMMPESLALVLQGVAVATLFALPFLDRSQYRHPLDRPLVTGAIVSGGVVLVGLSILGWLA